MSNERRPTVPTDEQMREREQFEVWVHEHVKQWEAPGTTLAEHLENVKHWLAREEDGEYGHHAVRDWWVGYRARAAEVQALRAALADVSNVPKHYESSPAEVQVEWAVEIARAALRGEEGTQP